MSLCVSVTTGPEQNLLSCCFRCTAALPLKDCVISPFWACAGNCKLGLTKQHCRLGRILSLSAMVDTIGQNISSVSYGWYDWKRETQIKIAFWFWLILNIINFYTQIICCKLHFTSKAADLICFSVVYRMAMQSTSSPSFRPAQLAGRSNTRTVPLKVKPENRCKNFRGLHASFIRTHFIYIYKHTHEQCRVQNPNKPSCLQYLHCV